MAAYRWSLLSLAIATALAADPSVTWIKAPPTQINMGESFEVSWQVEGLDGSYHSVCFFCPEDDGKVCRKGPDRHDSQMFDAQQTHQYSYTFTFDNNIPEGRYYATAIGAYSRSEYYPSSSILVSYSHQASASQSPAASNASTSTPASSPTDTQAENSQSSSTNSTSTTTNNTTVVRPAVVAPAIYWGNEEESSTVTVNGTGEAASASHENQEQRQEAAQENQSQRQDAYNQHEKQRPNHTENSARSSNIGRGEGRFGGGEHGSGGRGGFGGGHGGRR